MSFHLKMNAWLEEDGSERNVRFGNDDGTAARAGCRAFGIQGLTIGDCLVSRHDELLGRLCADTGAVQYQQGYDHVGQGSHIGPRSSVAANEFSLFGPDRRTSI